MVSIARKNLFGEKIRFMISILGVAFSAMLILIMLALYQGWNKKVGEYIENVDTDFWVVKKGSTDMFHSISLLPNSLKPEIESIPGVELIYPFVGYRTIVNFNGQELLTFIVGYNATEKIGGPKKILEGSGIPKESEIIIDQVFSKSKKINLGDKLKIADKDFTVSGISEGSNMAFFQFSFIDFDEAKSFFQGQDISNYFLVKVKPGYNKEEVNKKIEDVSSEIVVLTKSEFSEKSRKFLKDAFVPILFVLVIIAFITGVVVIGLTIYTATIEKSKEYGMLKAIGASNGDLYRIIFQQSLLSGIIGFVIGVIFSQIASWIIGQYVPEFVTMFNIADIIYVFLASILMSILAAYVPVRRIAKIDPALVFKS